MGKDLYESKSIAQDLFDNANEFLGYRITDIMFEGTEVDLNQTKVTQPAEFLYSVITALCLDDFNPDMVAGHFLGELTSLTAAGALTFEDNLRLVYVRAMAMKKACEAAPSAMAAIIGLPDEGHRKDLRRGKQRRQHDCPSQLQQPRSVGHLRQ